jgi:hypothetical protein
MFYGFLRLIDEGGDYIYQSIYKSRDRVDE